MLQCGICKEEFSSNDDLRAHLEGHASELFDSEEEFEENGIQSVRNMDQDSDDGSLVLDCVKEEEQLQAQQEETQTEGFEESSFAQTEAGNERRTLSKRKSSSETLLCSKCSFKTINKRKFKEHMNLMHLNKIKCDHCPKRYPTKGSLAYHLEKEHEEVDKPKLPEDEFFRIKEKRKGKQKERLYECLECTLKTRFRHNFYRHVRGFHRKLLEDLYKSKGMVRDGAEYHKCAECFYKTLDTSKLKRHVMAVHQKRRDFVCDLCKKAFSDKQSLGTHLKHIHISADPSELHKCSICSFKTIGKSNLKRHLNLVHLKTREFTCDLCQRQFSLKGNLRRHIENHHLEKSMLSCNRGGNASFRTEDKPELVRDIRRVHVKKFSSETLLCSKCPYKTINNDMLKHHMNLMHLNKYKCDNCPKRYPTKGSLAYHLEKKHEEVDKPKLPEDEFFRIKEKQGKQKKRLYECLECTLKTHIRSHIYRHIRGFHRKLLDDLYKSKGMVLGDAEYLKCAECFYKTLCLDKLRRHVMAVHQKRRDYVCDLCKKDFSDKQNLRRHLKNILSCNLGSNASFRTADKPKLVRDTRLVHVKKSSSETLMCSKCSYKSNSKNEFKRHMNQMHLNKYKCDHCPKSYPSNSRLANHIREKHTKEEDKPKLPEDEFFRIKEKQGKQKWRLYECLKCTHKTRIRSFIYRHIRGVHRKLLDDLYKSKGVVRDDIEYHKCAECFYKTLDISRLNRHVKTVHQKKRDYVCDLCKTAYSDKQSLGRHLKHIHNPAEPSELHKCSICSFKTFEKSNLKRHLNLVHLKIREFTCELCQKQYSSKNHLRRHIESHHLKKNE